ncbi:MAG TPA: TonB-dependent receptor [Bryobacteraceae bacterium]|nr:TonB-dependent receptor [Bryobacteraceae bacterium]HUO29860.1 TonB-dependent receptor [Bryobacteraceae bacterium]
MSRVLVNRALVALALFVALGTSNLVFGQGANSTLLGTVSDVSGAVVPNASVQVTNVATGVRQTVTTDSQGRYTVVDLIPGSYSVQASATGFQTVVRSGITLTVGSQTVVDIPLSPGQQQQTVTVQAEASQVDVVSSTLSSVVEQKQIADLPLNGRNFTDLIALAPGITTGNGVGAPAGGANLLYGLEANFSVSGARSEGQAYLLDDVDVQGFWAHGSGSGVLGTTLGIEAIAEFEVLTNTYSAQFGGNGAVVNTASKSGTNVFHGSAYEFFRNSALDASNFFDTSGKPAYRQNQFGASLGGPIKKDKLFFFINDEELRKSQGETVPTFIPDANVHKGLVPCALAPNLACSSGLANVGVSAVAAPILALYPQTTAVSPNGILEVPEVGTNTGDENYLLGRVDYTIDAKDSVFMRYVHDGASTILPFLGSSDPPRWPEQGITGNNFATVEWRRIVTPNLVNLLRFSFTRTLETDNQVNLDPTPALNFYQGHQNGGVSVTGLSLLGTSIFAPLSQVQNKFPVADDLIWNKGAHSFKFGGLFSRVQSNFTQDGWWGGSYTFTSIPSFLEGVPFLFIGPIPPYTDSSRDFREIEVDGYAQDEWKATPKLTVNIGVRYEFVTDPTTHEQPLNNIINPPFGTFVPVSHVFEHNPNTRNWDPRIGLAFDPFKDHKTSIRVGAGIFYDPIRARTYASGYYFNKPYELAFEIFPPFPNAFSSGYSNPSEIVGTDYNTHDVPHMYQWNINVQRELFENTVLTVGYVGSRGLHLYEGRDLNPVEPIDVNGVSVFGHLSPAGTIVGNPRENPAAASLSDEAPVGDSHYNSLQVGLNRRFSHGLQSQLSYTWSKCIDNSSGTSGLEGGAPWTDPLAGNYDEGRCQFDRSQFVKFSSVYSFPFRGNVLVEGWQLSGNFTYSSGAPWNILLGFDQAGNGNSGEERPNIISGVNPIVGSVNGYANPAAFSVPAVGTLGDLQRDYLSGPGLVDLDMALLKDTRLSEKFRLQFRAEFFNIANHANFGLPNGTAFAQGPGGTGIPNSTFGQITYTTTSSRQIQFALKLLF